MADSYKFKVQPIADGYTISMFDADDYFFNISLVVGIISELKVNSAQFHIALIKYNGLYLKKVCNNFTFCDLSEFYRMPYFKNKEDAKDFIANYIKPQQIIAKLQ